MRGVRAGAVGRRNGERGGGRGFVATPPYCVDAAVPSLWVRVPCTPHNSEVARGSTASAGAREAALLPLLRADVRAAARARDGGDSQPRGTEVRLSQLLLPAHDPRRLLRRPALRRDGRGVRRRSRVLLAGREEIGRG